VEELPAARPFGVPDASQPAFETPASRVLLLPPGGPLPEGCEAFVPLPDATRVAYVSRAAPGSAVEIAPDPFLRGNKFVPVHASATTLGALLSIAAGRRLDTGPDSERVLLILRGKGLVFLDNGDTMPVEAGWWAFVPGGEGARVWSQGPDDMLAVALQPRGPPVERRTLAGELAKRRAAQEPRDQ
jgi:hypothetical protein